MSATICPSCLSRAFDAGRCAKCSFENKEYKAPRGALQLGSLVGSYRIGVMKSNSRQSQVYTAVHDDTSVPVIIEEFFPGKVAVREQNREEVSLTSGDPGVAERFEQACRMIEASTQKRPLKRIDAVRANNTVYSVFEPVPTASVAAQCEMTADNPYYFRDQNGMPSMTINAMPIPPMPAARSFNPEQFRNPSPVLPTSEDSGFDNGIITENTGSEKKYNRFLIIGIAAALLVIIVIAVLIIGRLSGGSGTDPKETIPAVSADLSGQVEQNTEAGGNAETEQSAEDLHDQGTDDETEQTEILTAEAFAEQLRLVSKTGKETAEGFRLDSDGITFAEEKTEISLPARVKQYSWGEEAGLSLLKRQKDDLYILAGEGENWYKVRVGTKTSTRYGDADDLTLCLVPWGDPGDMDDSSMLRFAPKGGKRVLERLDCLADTLKWTDAEYQLENTDDGVELKVTGRQGDEETEENFDMLAYSPEPVEEFESEEVTSSLTADQLLEQFRLVSETDPESTTKTAKGNKLNKKNEFDSHTKEFKLPAQVERYTRNTEDAKPELFWQENGGEDLYILAENKGIRYRVRIGSRTAMAVYEDEEDLMLCLLLWEDLGDLKQGSKLKFKPENEGEAVLKKLDQDFAGTLDWTGAAFLIENTEEGVSLKVTDNSVNEQEFRMIPVAENEDEPETTTVAGDDSGSSGVILFYPESKTDPDKNDGQGTDAQNSQDSDNPTNEETDHQEEKQQEVTLDAIRTIDKFELNGDYLVIRIRAEKTVKNITVKDQAGREKELQKTVSGLENKYMWKSDQTSNWKQTDSSVTYVITYYFEDGSNHTEKKTLKSNSDK